MAKNDNQPSFRQEFLAPTAPRERKPLLFMLISLLSGALAILASLFPVWIRATNNRVLAYNLIGVINQDVGSDAVREENVPLLLLYVSGAVLLAVGGVCVLNRLKTASFFLMMVSINRALFRLLYHNSSEYFVALPLLSHPSGNT